MQTGTESDASEAVATLSPPPRRRWLRNVLITAGVFMGILLLAIAGLLLYFNDDYFKARVQQAIREELGRESTVARVQVSIWSGSVLIDDLHILNAEKGYGDPDTLRVKKVRAEIAVIPLLFNSARKIEALKIEIEKPELLVEYKGTWPVEKSNISDLLLRFKSDKKPSVWPKQTGLQALNCELIVKDGLFRVNDEELGEFSVPLSEATVKQAALGQPADAKVRLKLKTPHSEGSTDMDCRINWIGADGSIDPGKFKDVLVSLSLTQMDLGFLGRFQQLSGFVGQDNKYAWTLGKPYSGSISFTAQSLKDAAFKAKLETESVLSLWEAQKWVAGRIPGRCEIEINSGWDGTALKQGVSRFELVLAESTSTLLEKTESKLLHLEISGDTSKPTATVDLNFNTQMDKLFSTDIGTLLGLKDKIGGGLTGNIKAQHAPDGRLDAKCEFRTDQAYVAAGNLRQPTSALVSGDATLFPDADGVPERAEINNVMATADSFEFRSMQPVTVTALRDFEKMTTDAKLKINIRGREFWKQFQPLLIALNKPIPIEEELDGQLTMTIGSGKLKLRLDSSIKQQSPTPEPLLLVARGEFNIAQAESSDSFEVQLSSLTRPLSIQIAGALARSKTKRVLEISKLNATADHVAMQALDARFGKHGRLWVPAGVQLACGIQNTGALTLTQTLGADGKVISDEMVLKTTLKCPNVVLNIRDSLSNQLLNFADKEVSLYAEVLQKDMNVSVTALKLQASGFSMETSIDHADMGKIAEAMNATTLILTPPKAPANETPEAYLRRTKLLDDARAGHVKLWSAALPGARIDMKINPIGVAQLTSIMPKLGQLPAVDATLAIEYVPATLKANASLAITRNKATVPVTVSVDIQELLSKANGMMPLLASGAITPSHLVDLSPRIVLNAIIPAEILNEFTANALPAAKTTINVEYNSQTRHLLSSVELNGPALSLKAETDADIPTLVERLMVLPTYPPGTPVPLAPFIDLIPVLNVDARAGREGTMALLNLAGSPEPLGVGELLLKIQYDPKTAQLKVSQLALTNEMLSLSGTLSELSLPALAKAIDARAGSDLEKWLGALPAMALEFKATPKGIQRMQELEILPSDPVLAGEFSATFTTDRATSVLNLDASKFSGAAAELNVSARAIDLKALAAFLNLPPSKQKDPSQLGKLLPDVKIDLIARAPFVESLSRRADARLSAAGDLGVKLKYERASDELTLERVAFVRDAKSTFPVMALECLGSVSQVRTLLTRLDAQPQPKDLLPHFKNFSMPKLMVQGKDLVELLMQFKIGEAFTTDVSAGKYVMDQPLTLNNLNIRNAGTPDALNVWFQASTPITVKEGAEKSALFGGTWRFDEQFPLRVSLAGNAFGAAGTLNLDDAEIFAAALSVIDSAKKPYSKAVGAPCKINLKLEQDAGGVVSVPLLELRGGPLQATLTGLTWNRSQPKLMLQMESLAIEGVFPGRVTKLALNEAADKMQFTAQLDTFDAARFIPAEKLPPGVTLHANVTGASVVYDGPFSTFNAESLAAALQLSVNKIDVQAVLASPAQNATFSLSTNLAGTLAGVSSTGIDVGLAHAHGVQKTDLKMTMGLSVAARPGQTLLSAADAPTLPLLVTIPMLTVSTPVQLPQLLAAINLLSTAIPPAPAAVPPKPKAGLEGIRDLRVQLGLSGPPELTVSDAIVVKDVAIQSLKFENLRADITEARATLFGDAKLQIKRLGYNLPTDDFAADLRIDNLNLHTVMTLDGKKPAKDEYQLFGLAGVAIQINGRGPDIRALNGTIDTQIVNLVAEKNGGKYPDDLKSTLAAFGTKSALGLLGSALENKAGAIGRKLNWAVILFSEDFGLFLPRLEFDTLTLSSMPLSGGTLTLNGSLVGKEQSAGLQIDFKGGIDLVKNSFAPNLQLFLNKLPEKTQKAMRLDQVSEADRALILTEFAQGKFQPIVLSGPVSTYATNTKELIIAFNNLESRIAEMIDAKKKAEQPAPAAETTPPPGDAPATQPPPKKTTADGIRDLFGGDDKKKKE